MSFAAANRISHMQEAERMRELHKNNSVSQLQAASAVAAARLASIDMERAQVEIEAIMSRLKEFQAAHSKE